MAHKEVFRVEITEVIRQWQAGRGVREITRSTGLARNTVRKYLIIAQSCGLTRDGPSPTEFQLLTLVQVNKVSMSDMRDCHWIAYPGTDKQGWTASGGGAH